MGNCCTVPIGKDDQHGGGVKTLHKTKKEDVNGVGPDDLMVFAVRTKCVPGTAAGPTA